MATLTKLEDRVLLTLKPADKPYNRHIGGGLYAYVYPNGRVVCKYQYQMGGKRRKYTLGDYVEKKGRAAEIFKKYEYVHGNRVINKIDPVAEQEKRDAEDAKLAAEKAAEVETKEAVTRAKENRLTIADLAEHFLKDYTGSKLQTDRMNITEATRRQYEHTLQKHILPNHGADPLDSLPIYGLKQYIIDSKSNQIMAVFSAMFTWAAKQPKYNQIGFNANPLAGMEAPQKIRKLTRVLDWKPEHKQFKDKGEIRAFWEWLPTINPNHANALRLVLLFGIRPSEVLGLQWEDVSADSVIIPAEKMKSKHDIHIIPLTPQAQAVIADIRANAKSIEDKDYLFPRRPRSRGGLAEGDRSVQHVGHATLSSHVLDAIRDGNLKVEKFSPRDLRRTVYTHCRSMGVSRSDAEALTHHKEAGIFEHYDFADQTEAKFEALTKWHDRIDKLAGLNRPANVTNIRQGAKSSL